MNRENSFGCRHLEDNLGIIEGGGVGGMMNNLPTK